MILSIKIVIDTLNKCKLNIHRSQSATNDRVIQIKINPRANTTTHNYKIDTPLNILHYSMTRQFSFYEYDGFIFHLR